MSDNNDFPTFEEFNEWREGQRSDPRLKKRSTN